MKPLPFTGYRHWSTSEPVTEEWARANGHAPPTGERWYPSTMTPYRHARGPLKGRRMNARAAYLAGLIAPADFEDPVESRPHKGNPDSVAKAASKREQLQASAEESERQALAARAGSRKAGEGE